MLYRSFLPLISAHVFCACRVCVKCAQTQISGLKNFIFQSSYPFSKLFCGRVVVGGCPLQSDTNRIQKHTASVNWKACVRVLPASRQSACRADPLHESSAACRVRVALPVSQSVRCAYALPPVRASRPCSVAHPVRAHMGQNVALWENMPQKREFGQ